MVGAGIKLQWQSRSQGREVISALSTALGQTIGLPADAPLRHFWVPQGYCDWRCLEPTPLANDAQYRETA